MGFDSGLGASTKKTTTPVDGADRKFYMRASEKSGDQKILQNFDAALNSQRKKTPPQKTPPKPPATSMPAPPTRPTARSLDRQSPTPATGHTPREQVKPTRAEDPSDQKFYNMAADRQNKIINLENRAASLNKDIDALSTASPYAAQAMQAEVKAVERELAALQGPAPSSTADRDPARLTDQELARHYAPVLVLPDGDYDLPADPQKFIENSRWREDRSGWPDKEHGNNINGAADDNFTAADVGQRGEEGRFLDLADNQRKIGNDKAPFFYQISRSDNPDEPTKITYWFFYAYNDGPGPQNHEGDFERITIELDPDTGRPGDAIYSAHSNKHTEPTPYRELETYRDPVTGEDTGRPLVYVASGSHASYPTPGTHRSDAPGALRRLVDDDRLDDHAVDSLDQKGTRVIDTGENLHNVEAQPWYPSSGGGVHWGEPGNADDLPGWNSASSGPAGPSEEKKHVELE